MMSLYITIIAAVLFPVAATIIIKKESLPDFKQIFLKINRWNILTYVFLPGMTAALFIVLKNRQEIDTIELVRRDLLIFFGYIAAVSDLRHKIVPNKYPLVMIGLWVLMTFPLLLIDIESTVQYVISAGIGFLLSGGLFFIVYLISRAGLGGGDVKFMAAAGLYLTFYGVLPAMLYGSVLCSVVGITLILLKKIKLKDSIPLAPFLYAGILITIFTV